MTYKEWHEKKLSDIRNNPENHKHSFEDLQICCINDGAIDLSIMDAHSEYVDMGTNGGVRCDTTSGPCACGATH